MWSYEEKFVAWWEGGGIKNLIQDEKMVGIFSFLFVLVYDPIQSGVTLLLFKLMGLCIIAYQLFSKITKQATHYRCRLHSTQLEY